MKWNPDGTKATRTKTPTSRRPRSPETARKDMSCDYRGCPCLEKKILNCTQAATNDTGNHRKKKLGKGLLENNHGEGSLVGGGRSPPGAAVKKGERDRPN